MSFIEQTKKNFLKVSDAVLENLKSTEAITINLHAEDTNFIRWNKNLVRQTTQVEQIALSFKLQGDGRTFDFKFPLTGDTNKDISSALLNLGRARLELKALPKDTHQVEIKNNGESSSDFEGQYPTAAELIHTISETAEGSDLAGLACSGPVISANRNSAGQNHWFSTDSFFIDYSLYNGPLAVKSCYANSKWDSKTWITNLANSKNQLSLMNKPVQNIKPGNYRVYLAPAAVSEIMGTVSWNGLSQNSFQRGKSPFQKLGKNEVRFSEKLNLRENFELGLGTRFNSDGELSKPQLDLIKDGKLVQFLTSSRSAKEFSVAGNAAGSSEYLRVPEILPGTLKQSDILKQLDTGLYLSNLHYINWSDQMSARITGMTRYACFWVEKGEIVGPIKDLRFDNSLYDIWGPSLENLTEFQEIDPAIDTYFVRSIGGKKLPGMLINSFKFTL